MTSRRDFVGDATLLGVAFAFPGAEWRLTGARGDRGAGGPGAQDAWAVLREQFYIAPRGIYFNSGTIGASPRPVVEAVIRHMQAFETVFDAQGVDLAALRTAVGSLLGAPPHSFAFTRNTTEAMNWVAAGLELEPGTEVLMTDHEHVGGRCPWEMNARRGRWTISRVPLPVPARSADEVMERWSRAITSRTRVAMISHVTFTNGLIQPVKDLCAMFRRQGIITVIDGAHPPGMLRTDLTDLGCDFYCSSPHKWLLAPKGTGLLYISEPWLDRLWPTIASGGWDDLAAKGERFDRVGTRNDSLLAGFKAALEFHESIGRDRVERRVRELGDRLYDGLVRLDGVEMKSPSDRRIRAPLVSFTVRGWNTDQLIQELWRRGPVRVRHVAEYDYHWVRLSTHVYNTELEVDRVIGLVRELAGERR
jgi:isopenicillin-N epimerase